MTRGKKRVPTLEEIRKSRLDRELEALPFLTTPPAERMLSVGDEVVVGQLRNCIVEEVLYDGKIYRVSYDREDRDLGLVHDENYFTWTDLRKRNRIKHTNLLAVDNRIVPIYSQRQLEGLLTMVYHFGVDFSPSYQRDFVWTEEEKVALIDSIYHGVDIGKFVFVHLGYSGEYGYEVLDGKQRLNALCEFYENRFPYKGVYFDEMSGADRNHFRGYNVSYAEYHDLTDAQKIKAFILLNTTGVRVATEQLEYAKELYKKATGEDYV